MLHTWCADSYNRSSLWQQEINQQLISSHSFKGNEIILDIGSGTGQLTNSLAELLPQGYVVGIDHSENMIEYAKNKFERQNLKFLRMNAEQLGFYKKFDVIVSTFCLHWIPDKEKFFKNLSFYLKKNGKIYFIIPFENITLRNIRKKLMKQAKWSIYFADMNDPQDVVLDANHKEYAIQANFNNIQYYIKKKSIYYENKVMLADILKNVTACVSFLPKEELKNQFINEFITEYLNINPLMQDGSCQVLCTYAQLRATYPVD